MSATHRPRLERNDGLCIDVTHNPPTSFLKLLDIVRTFRRPPITSQCPALTVQLCPRLAGFDFQVKYGKCYIHGAERKDHPVIYIHINNQESKNRNTKPSRRSASTRCSGYSLGYGERCAPSSIPSSFPSSFSRKPIRICSSSLTRTNY